MALAVAREALIFAFATFGARGDGAVLNFAHLAARAAVSGGEAGLTAVGDIAVTVSPLGNAFQPAHSPRAGAVGVGKLRRALQSAGAAVVQVAVYVGLALGLVSTLRVSVGTQYCNPVWIAQQSLP